jgi:hypothetical protein
MAPKLTWPQQKWPFWTLICILAAGKKFDTVLRAEQIKY